MSYITESKEEEIINGLFDGPPREMIQSSLEAAANRKIHQKDIDATTANQGQMLAPNDKITNSTHNKTYAITPPSPYQRLFAVCNLPLAWRVTFGVADDVFKSEGDFPFSFVENDKNKVSEAKYSDDVLSVFRDINFLNVCPQMVGIGEMDGEALLIMFEEGFDYTDKELTRKPRDPTKKILYTMTIPMYFVSKETTIKEDNWTAEGKPIFWHINFGSIDVESTYFQTNSVFHHSRIIHYVPQRLDISSKGLSTLDRCWQAITIGFNIDIGVGEAFFRWGPGHPVIETTLTDEKQLNQFMNKISPPTRRQWHALLKGWKLTFAGTEAHNMNLEAKDWAVYKETSIATKIPHDILTGVTSGAVIGNEVNERSYWSVLSTKQNGFRPVIWKLCAILKKTGQLSSIPEITYDPDSGILKTPKNIEIKYTVHYVETEAQKLDLLTKKWDIIIKSIQILTLNEVREYANSIMNNKDIVWEKITKPIGEQIMGAFSMNPDEPEEEKPKGEPNEVKTPEDPENEPENDPEKIEAKDSMLLIGCPTHDFYNKKCPTCIRVKLFRENMAKDMLDAGHSKNKVSSFMRMDRNKINELG